jgi:hypothetical protein
MIVPKAKKAGTAGRASAGKSMDEWRDQCNCERCPSYTDCSLQKKELLFCMTGKTDCDVERRGCVCPTCPVHRANDFLMKYYCMNGSEEEQRKL